MSDFETYDLLDLARNPNELYSLAGGLLPEMAETLRFDLSNSPNIANLREFIGYISPEKTLQDNIALTTERLSRTNADPVKMAADWIDRSGSLNELYRGFVTQDAKITEKGFDAAVFNTAVARWQERRAKMLIELKEEGIKFGRAIIFAGNRNMGPTEHSEVEAMMSKNGVAPTESEFASSYIRDMLVANDIDTQVVAVDSNNGDEVIKEGILQNPYIYDGGVLVVGNAPSTVQAAAQFRKAARTIELPYAHEFDIDGNQLMMAGDTIPVARHGESPETHQNPFSSLGQIARNAMFLYEQSKTLEI